MESVMIINVIFLYLIYVVFEFYFRIFCFVWWNGIKEIVIKLCVILEFCCNKYMY